MPHEHLGLFDTPPGALENRFALAIVASVFVVFLAVLPVCNIRLGEFDAFIPTIYAVILVGELIVATLLYAQAAVFRSRALTVLASGYVFTALLLIPYALSFPGAFAFGGLLHAGVSTTAWLMIFRRWGTPLSVILYLWLRRADQAGAPDAERAAPPVVPCLAAAVSLVVVLTLLATAGRELLPPIFSNRSDVISSRVLLANLAMIAPVAVALALLLRWRESVLDTWLVVSLATMLAQTLLNLPLHARFTVGFYALLVLTLVSHLIVLLALIAESNRLYVRLALSTAARSREWEARMMSMDGVAAAISHEVGQPLAAATLSATAGLSWLNRPQPEPEKAIRSLRDTIDATQRAFDVVKSIRAMFSPEKSSLSQFDLNDLVRESASLLDREMAAQKVSLRLALDEPLPPILANRIQIQRVLVNLLTNAIESLADTKRARRIAIRSAASDAQTLRVEVSDSGDGIPAEAMIRIFEPFFTTKSSGTGLGLSLSRSIVEGHGGRLWASPADDGGATFHLELRLSPAPEG